MRRILTDVYWIRRRVWLVLELESEMFQQGLKTVAPVMAWRRRRTARLAERKTRECLRLVPLVVSWVPSLQAMGAFRRFNLNSTPSLTTHHPVPIAQVLNVGI